MKKPPSKTPSNAKVPRRPAKAQKGLTVHLQKSHGRTISSQLWLTRQLNDPYVKKALADGYRSRAAYKLTEIDDHFKIFKPGMTVVDLGATPGGWTQVAIQRIQGKGLVIALDINPMDPVPGTHFLQGDFLEAATVASLRTLLRGDAGAESAIPRQVDIVLSDMASPATGHPQTDHWRIMGLAQDAFSFAEEVLAPNGTFIAKVLQGGTESQLLQHIKKSFSKVRHFKPPASRKGSAEIYLVAIGFHGLPFSENILEDANLGDPVQ